MKPTTLRYAATLLSLVSTASFAGTFTVTTTADAGPGSLRQAITDANALAGADEINFNIGGGGLQTIDVPTALPDITDTVTIDGTTQPGFSGTPIVTLKGNSSDFVGQPDGLRIESPGVSNVRGLVIIDFFRYGIVVQDAGGATIMGNFIGVDASGSAAAGNGGGVLLWANSGPVVVGGASPGARNVISGNLADGITIEPPVDHSPSVGNIIQGNFIGVDASGVADLGNGTGIQTHGGDDNRIGGALPGEGNVISGNRSGIIISSFGTIDPATGNVLQGNLIGLNASGTAGIMNSRFGVWLISARGTTIGGTDPGARNVISVSGINGIWIFRSNDTVVAGNFIGTDITGTVNRGNLTHGVGISGAVNTTIGGTEPGAGNLISGNGDAGIFSTSTQVNNVLFPSTGNLIAGNRIGTNAAGSGAIANGNGLTLFQTQNSRVEGNLISGNRGHGILVTGGDAFMATIGIPIRGNRIGTDAAGTAPVPNGGNGIRIERPFVIVDIPIGGTSAGHRNIIRHNIGAGISAADGNGNPFLGNSIDLNGRLGIDIAEDGVTPNDPLDADHQLNNRQNRPVLTAANMAGSTFVTGSLHSRPGRAFRIEFFHSPAGDPSGFGEGRAFLGFAEVTTDGGGNAVIAAALPLVAEGDAITATATDLTSMNTSEFSNVVAAGLAPTLNIADVAVVEGDSGTTTAVFTVSLTAPSAGDVTFQFATADGTATAPADYTATSGMAIIPAGSLSTTISVTVVGETAVEPDETFAVNITDVAGAAAGDVEGEGTIAADDADAAPGIPTLSQWAIILMAVFLTLAGVTTMRA